MKHTKITFIGAGNMARNMIIGLLAEGIPSKNILVTNRSTDKLIALKSEYHVQTSQDNIAAVETADILVLAVKPFQMQQVCEQLADTVKNNRPLVISVAGAVTTEMMRRWLGDESVALVRTMPNTPSAVQAGATALYAVDAVSDAQKELATSFMAALGLTMWVHDEDQVERIAALSGSGPAYVFLIMEALQAAGEALGIPKDKVSQLTAQTVLGAAKMAIETQKDFAELRRSVTVPKGTTEPALAVLQSGDITKLFTKALQAANKRAHEITQMLDK